MANDESRPTDDLAEAYRRLDPYRPLPSGSPWYVDCSEARGIRGFIERLLWEIEVTAAGSGPAPFIHKLVSGHRGTG